DSYPVLVAGRSLDRNWPSTAKRMRVFCCASVRGLRTDAGRILNTWAPSLTEPTTLPTRPL
ncbi:MAG: hypothetical protein IH595_03545, partial [Bacteroidales bacterium]|nr:hypothetical protein [Bacteroidales bacterium]